MSIDLTFFLNESSVKNVVYVYDILYLTPKVCLNIDIDNSLDFSDYTASIIFSSAEILT